MQTCHYTHHKSAKLRSAPAQCAGEVSSVCSLVAAWRPSLVTTLSELRQYSASCVYTSTNAGHRRLGTVAVTTLARGHVATGALSRPPEPLAAGVECVWSHDSGGILILDITRLGTTSKLQKKYGHWPFF